MFRRFKLMLATRTLLAAALAVVCLAPLHGQRLKQPVAKVLDLYGQVSVTDHDGGMLQALATNVPVKQTQVIVTGPDGWAKFMYLNDGSTFEVFPNSKVVFQEHPADWNSLLNVWIGHIKVWIQHAPGVPNYKNVTTPTALISVRGTVFSIDVQDPDTTTVAVEEGAVDVKNTTVPVPAIPRLGPGQSITIIRGQQLGLNRVNQQGFNLARALEDAVIRTIYIARGGVGGPIGGPVGTGGGAQGDKGKTTGQPTGGAPAPPSAPTPPPAPPAPGGGH